MQAPHHHHPVKMASWALWSPQHAQGGSACFGLSWAFFDAKTKAQLARWILDPVGLAGARWLLTNR